MGTLAPAFVSALADRYRIERELGAGGMATVYLAEDIKHHRQVAIKVLRDDLTASLGKERFLREISIAAGLTHPHILPLHDSGEAGGHLFYVMPYVDGQTLRQRLVRTGELPIGEAVRALRDVADAMSHAHKRGVVHRDLKPENVMLSDRHALVMDFGVAKALSEATGKQQLTTMGVALGTPSYMSPEQATADPLTDHRSDIYSFGIIAYELLTGRTPFAGGSPQEMLAAHVTAAVPPITTHRASIPPALAAFVMRCLEKKPSDRWQSADEMIPQLEALLTPSGGITPHQTAPYATVGSSGATTRRRWIAPAVVTAVAVLSGVGLYMKQGVSAGSPASGGSTKPAVWVLVLPPQNLGAPGDSLLADGLVDEVRGALSRIPGLDVKGSRSSQTFKGSSKSIPEIAREVGDVAYVVTSSVRWVPAEAGSGRVVMTTELLDAGTEAVRGRSLVDTTLADLYSGQTAVAQRAARELAALLELSPSAGTVTSADRAGGMKVNRDAYATYLAGRAEFSRFTGASIDRSIDLFKQSALLDSTFAKSHAWLAFALYERGAQASDGTDRLAATSLQRAVALAPDDPDVLTARAWARRRDWDWAGARSDLARVIEIDPTSPWALWGLTVIEAALGNYERSVELGRRAAEVDPVVAGDIYPLALRFAGRHDEALAAARAGLAIDSLSTSNCWWCEIGYALAVRGDVEGYRHADAKAFALGRGRLNREVSALAVAGRTREARAELQKLRAAFDRKEFPSPLRLVDAYASLGEADSAFAWFSRAADSKSQGIHNFAVSPFVAPLRSDPRYTALLKRVGLR